VCAARHLARAVTGVTLGKYFHVSMRRAHHFGLPFDIWRMELQSVLSSYMRLAGLRTALFALCATAVCACASSTEPEEALTVAATAPRYVRDSIGAVTITFRVSNGSRTSVYLPTCGGTINVNLDQRIGGAAWLTSASTGACYSSFYAGPLRLDPGQSVQATETVRLAPGEYRLSVPVALAATSDANRAAYSASISVL
jgi:hypothetical protein